MTLIIFKYSNALLTFNNHFCRYETKQVFSQQFSLFLYSTHSCGKGKYHEKIEDTVAQSDVTSKRENKKYVLIAYHF